MLYTDLIDPVLARVEGCPRAVVVDAMRNSCMDFCTRSRWLVAGTQVTVNGTEVPSFDLDTQVIDIAEARIAGEQILVTYMNDPRVDELETGEHAIVFTDPNNIELIPPATVAEPITIDLLVIVAPGPASTEIHVDLWRRWSEALKHGALCRLYEEPGKPWSNPQAGVYCRGMYEDAITSAAAEAGRNRTQPARRLRTKPY
jgi:hypothetical protein